MERKIRNAAKALIIKGDKNVEKDVVNIDFSCRYLSGELTTSNESSEVMWVRKEDALDMVTFPLTRKRLQNMLSESDKVNCFCFKIFC